MAINDRDTIVTFSNIWITFYSLQYLKLNSYKNKKYIYYLGFLLALGMGVRFAFVATLIPIFIYGIYIIAIVTSIESGLAVNSARREDIDIENG